MPRNNSEEILWYRDVHNKYKTGLVCYTIQSVYQC